MSTPSTASSTGLAWPALLLEVSRQVRLFMLKHRPTGEMPETGITVHLAYAVAQACKRAGTGLAFEADIEMAGFGGERKHGADIELWLSGSGLALRLRLQAKSLHPAKSAIGKADPYGNYKYLDHFVGGDKDRPQVMQLIKECPDDRTAGYIFYNGLAKVPSVTASNACCRDDLWPASFGVNSLGLTYAPATAFATESARGSKGFHDVYRLSRPLVCIGTCPLSKTAASGGSAVPSDLLLVLDTALALAQAGLLIHLVALTKQSIDALPDALAQVDIEWGDFPDYIQRLRANGSCGFNEQQERPAGAIISLSLQQEDE